MKSKYQKMEKIIKLYYGDVYKVCFHFTKDEAKAKELVKDVFVNLYNEIDRLEKNQGLDLSRDDKSELVVSYLIFMTKKLYIRR